MHNEEIVWNDPKTKLPETKQIVLFKVVILHNQKIKHGRFEDGTFFDSDAAGLAYDAKDIFGWVAFQDSNKRV